MATQSEVRDLLARIRARGYKVTKSGTKHYKVLKKSDRPGDRDKWVPVMDEHGPMIVSSSPSDANWRDMAVQRLRRAGVFADDPFKATRGEGGARNGRSAQEERRREAARQTVRRAARAKGDDARERTSHLRAQLERMVSKLGGWNTGHGTTTGVSLADVVRALHAFADENVAQRNDVAWPTSRGVPSSVAAASQMLATLRRPHTTVGVVWLPLVEQFVEFLYDGDPNDSAAAAARFKVAVRRAKGETDASYDDYQAAPEPDAGLVIPPEPEPEPEPDHDAAPAPHPLTHMPDMALRALFWMARGADPTERGEVIALAKRIAELTHEPEGAL